MKVSVVKIKNILGIEELEFKPSDHGLTLVRGGNATGKTSVVSALQALLGGGNDATLLRHGAEAGEAVLVLDDGTEVGMRTDGEKTERWAKDPKRGRFSSVKATIDQWVNHGSFNPVEFLSTNPGSPGDRVRMVLAAAPIALSKEQVARVRAWAAMPAEPPTKDHLEEIVTGHALVGLDEVRKLIYEERRVVNRELDRARKGAERLRLSLPPGSAEGKDPGEAVKAWESALQSNQEAATAAEVQSVKEEEKLVTGIHAGYETKIQALGVETRAREQRLVSERDEAALAIEAEMEALRKRRAALLERYNVETSKRASEYTEAVQSVKAARDLEANNYRERCSSNRAKVSKQHRENLDRIRAELTTARAAVAEAGRLGNTRKLLADAEAERDRAQERSAGLTDALAQIDATRDGLLKSFPLDGVAVVDGEVHLRGTPFPRLSGAEQVDLALRISEMSAGELGLVVLDGFEKMDQDKLVAFASRASQSRCQFVATRVERGALRVSGWGEPEEYVIRGETARSQEEDGTDGS